MARAKSQNTRILVGDSRKAWKTLKFSVLERAWDALEFFGLIAYLIGYTREFEFSLRGFLFALFAEEIRVC